MRKFTPMLVATWLLLWGCSTRQPESLIVEPTYSHVKKTQSIQSDIATKVAGERKALVKQNQSLQ